MLSEPPAAKSAADGTTTVHHDWRDSEEADEPKQTFFIKNGLVGDILLQQFFKAEFPVIDPLVTGAHYVAIDQVEILVGGNGEKGI